MINSELIKSMIEQKCLVHLNKNTRKRNVVYARAIYFKLLKEFTKMTLESIGETVNRDHSSVLYGINKFEQLQFYKEPVLSVYEEIKEDILRDRNENLKKDPLKYYESKYKNLKYKYKLLLDKYEPDWKNKKELNEF